ncbi:MAG TPA: 23S rRNA (uracil(1939)-C(5))-methyltransferase RlmD [Chitinophagaceae bacterium]|nr:23S rRNA (uracil(1939)-C(5))-methyltransferase RlmD [Chitinophagaceae bacterium]
MRKSRTILENVFVTNYAAEGKAVARVNGKVLFVEGAVPGDIADVVLSKSRKDWAEGKVVAIKEYSKERVQPFCIHFGVCGGCKWQMLPYNRQLGYKQQECIDAFKRIGKMDEIPVLPILGSADTIHYRNKLEFAFSNRKYLTEAEFGQLQNNKWPGGALGYHVPRLYDKVIDISECWLMDDINNLIRNSLRDYALKNDYSFYDIKEHKGWLRNIIIRQSSIGELMVNVMLGYDEPAPRQKLCDYLLKTVPSITTLLYTINSKWNDTIYDIETNIVFGKGFIMEKLGDFDFKISPKSFFQTNTKQAERLYTAVKKFASLTGTEIVYDLYCGTGSIGIFLSKNAKSVIGVDVTDDAIQDARENATINNIPHASFFSGDVIKICDDNFFKQHGKPDVVIVDPPRAGLHEKLVKKILEIAPSRMVYVSCNVATQARDILLLGEKYQVVNLQPVDMFPHTHHIECVAALKLK